MVNQLNIFDNFISASNAENHTAIHRKAAGQIHHITTDPVTDVLDSFKLTLNNINEYQEPP